MPIAVTGPGASARAEPVETTSGQAGTAIARLPCGGLRRTATCGPGAGPAAPERGGLAAARAAVGRSSNQGLPRSRPSAFASREARPYGWQTFCRQLFEMQSSWVLQASLAAQSPPWPPDIPMTSKDGASTVSVISPLPSAVGRS